MDNPHLLDALGFSVSLVYLVASMTAALLSGRAGRTTLRRLIVATRLARTAVCIAAVNILVQALDAPNDGLIWPVIWVVVLGCAVMSARSIRKRRDLKGDQVVAEAERTVRNYGPTTREL